MHKILPPRRAETPSQTAAATSDRYLRTHPASTPKTIAEATGLNPATVRQTCTRMLADAQVTCDPSGRYALPGGAGDTGTVTPVTRVTQPALTCGNGADHE